MPKMNLFTLFATSRPRFFKRLVVLLIDACCCIITVWLAFTLRLGAPVSNINQFYMPSLISIVICLPTYAIFGLYNVIYRYLSWSVIFIISIATGVYGLFYSTIYFVLGVEGVPRTIGIIQPLLLLIVISITRMLAAFALNGFEKQSSNNPAIRNVLIYGANRYGIRLASAIAASRKVSIVGLIDGDISLIGRDIQGIRVYSPVDISYLKLKFNIKDIYLALPGISRKERISILNDVRKHHLSIRTIPDFEGLTADKISTSDIRDLAIEDLLERDSVPADNELLTKSVYLKTIIVTGAGGSIGSEICGQILKYNPRQVILIDHCEYNLYQISGKLQQQAQFKEIEITPIIGSVCDKPHMTRIINIYKPDAIYHAAAYKHVPLVEHNVLKGAYNNIFGTKVMVESAVEGQVKEFVLISTDKAVRPTNIMGASKRVSELILQAEAADFKHGTILCMVRFGNVLNSSGSVIPLFREQISNGGPVTVTHPEITRFFMTIPEAAQLVIQAAAMAVGGEVFVLDMGEPVKIYDLAKRMIEMSGLSIKADSSDNGDIEIEYVGLRPGEKLYEELLLGDNTSTTLNPRIFKATETFHSKEFLYQQLNILEQSIEQYQLNTFRETLLTLVPEYVSEKAIVDWLYSRESK